MIKHWLPAVFGGTLYTQFHNRNRDNLVTCCGGRVLMGTRVEPFSVEVLGDGRDSGGDVDVDKRAPTDPEPKHIHTYTHTLIQLKNQHSCLYSQTHTHSVENHRPTAEKVMFYQNYRVVALSLSSHGRSRAHVHMTCCMFSKNTHTWMRQNTHMCSEPWSRARKHTKQTKSSSYVSCSGNIGLWSHLLTLSSIFIILFVLMSDTSNTYLFSS